MVKIQLGLGGSDAPPLDLLAKRSYKSYKARLYAERRLRYTGHWWNAAQFTLAIALISVSVLGLPGQPSSDDRFAALLVVLAVVALAVSMVVSFLSHAARAREMFANYRALQAFSVELESLSSSKKQPTPDQMGAFRKEYNSLLDKAENHLPIDHEVAVAGGPGKLSALNLVRYILPYLVPGTIAAAALAATCWSSVLLVAW